MTDLGDLPGGGDFSLARRISDTGQVVGESGAATGDRASLWTSGTMTDLGDLPGGGDFSEAFGINGSGQVVGKSGASTGTRAFLWDGGIMSDLGDLPGGSDFSEVFGINDSGQVVGRSGTAIGDSAFLWDDVYGMRDLNTLIDPGLGWTLSEATAINASGQIVGYGNAGDGTNSAFLLTPVEEMTPVPLPAGLPLLAACLGALAVVRRSRRRARPQRLVGRGVRPGGPWP